jgi:hypothetical protein
MFRMCLLLLLLILGISIRSQAGESPTTGRKIDWGAFVDSQYAYDFNSPPNGDRSFSTQPARSNEFNVNLAFIEAKFDTAKERSRFAIQAGTSVQSNYSSEPTRGAVSGPSLSRLIQEARVGYAISDSTWVDAGIFFAHVGSESWISKENLTLTRSLVAENSPYYLSGVKITHSLSEQLTIKLLVVNGWQNISENNPDKSIGLGIEFAMGRCTLAYNDLLGREKSPDLNGAERPSKFRHFHNFILKGTGTDSWEWIAQFDFGFQEKSASSGVSDWNGASLMARYALNSEQKIALRAESFQDLDQIVVVTNTTNGFAGLGASVGFDQSLADGILWRTEIRYLKTGQDVFPKQNGLASENWTTTSSWAVSF